jgi:hypothetical protein
MLNVTEIASSTEERVLSGMKVSQAFVLDGIKNTLAVADRVVPATVGDRIEERVSTLPSATPVIDGMFNFAMKVLEAQREFAGELVELFQPAAPKAAAKAAPAARKAPAKKAGAKRAAKKAA